MSDPYIVRAESADSRGDFVLPLAFFLICHGGLREKPTKATFCFLLYSHSCPVTKDPAASTSPPVALNKRLGGSPIKIKNCKKGREK